MKARSFPQIHVTYHIQDGVLIRRKFFGLIPSERISLQGATIRTDDGFFLRNIQVTGNNAQMVCRNLPFAFSFPKVLEAAVKPKAAADMDDRPDRASVDAPELPTPPEKTFQAVANPRPAPRFTEFASDEAAAGYRWILDNTPVHVADLTGDAFMEMGNVERNRPHRRRYTATFDIARPIEVVWYVVLDFANIGRWKLGSPGAAGGNSKPMEFSIGDMISGSHGGTIHRCHIIRACADEPEIRRFAIYGGHGWEFELSAVSDMCTHVRLSKLYYNEPGRSFAPVFGKKHPEIAREEGLAQTEANSFRTLCLELGEDVQIWHHEPGPHAWIDSLGVKDLPEAQRPEIVYVRD